MRPKTTLVERMARAIAGAAAAEPDAPAYPLITRTRVWETFKPAALAALGAMREPTPKMLHACAGAMSADKRPVPGRVSVKNKHRIRYRAMIDAAIADADDDDYETGPLA